MLVDPLVAAEIDVQLPVRKIRLDPAAETYRECGLPHTGRTREYDDRNPGAAGRRRQLCLDPVDEFVPPHESQRQGRQLGRSGGGLGGLGPEASRYCQTRVRFEDAGVQGPQFLAGLDAQLLHQFAAGLLIDVQRFCLPPGPVQGQHQQAPEVFAQRVVHGCRTQLLHQLRMPAEAEFGLEVRLQGGESLVHQRGELVLPQGVRGNVRQGCPTPCIQRLGQ